jgi:hypothetical protein
MARKIDKIEASSLSLDGHVHVYSNPRTNANKWWRDPGSRKLKNLVKTVSVSGINCVGVVNAGDDRNYERWMEQADDLPDGWDYYQDERVTQIIAPGFNPIYFFKSEELFTKKGHILVWGTKAGEKVPDGLSLDKTLDMVEKDPILTVISDHTFYKGGCGKLGSLKGREERFDAYEWNSMAGFSNRKTIERAKQDRKPVVRGSDAHRPKYIGKAYNLFGRKDLSFADGKKLIKSINENVKYNNFLTHGKLTPFAFFHHAYMVSLDHKHGLLEEDRRVEREKPIVREICSLDTQLREIRRRLVDIDERCVVDSPEIADPLKAELDLMHSLGLYGEHKALQLEERRLLEKLTSFCEQIRTKEN